MKVSIFPQTMSLCVFLFLPFLSCKKGWLDGKPNSSLVVPSTVGNFQALLDNPVVFNVSQNCLGEMASDDYYLNYSDFKTLQPIEQNSYIWQPDLYSGVTSVPDWDNSYKAIFITNLALEGLSKLPTDSSITNIAGFNNAKGSALYYRAFQFYQLVQTFCLPFDSASFTTDAGIPLKLSSDVNINPGRGTTKQDYDQIISDLTSSCLYLPSTPLSNNYNRPSKVAAYSLLARIFLSIGDYKNALLYSDSSLQIHNTLIDFNTLDPTAYNPIPYPNAEISMDYELNTYSGVTYDSYVDSTLYNSYDSNDLRKVIYFFNNGVSWQFFPGDYYSYYALFGGTATDEMFLTRAESYARLGNVTAAMADLNALLINRYKKASYTNFTAATPKAALDIILAQRRKELVFRGTRWYDLRRLNLDNNYKTTLTRIVNGQTYTLVPGDPRYAYPIPPEELQYNNIPQNNR